MGPSGMALGQWAEAIPETVSPRWQRNNISARCTRLAADATPQPARDGWGERLSRSTFSPGRRSQFFLCGHGCTLAGNSFCAAKAAPLWARPRARRKLLFPLPGERRGSRRALLPAGASRVRGYFFPFSFTQPIASRTFRANSSGHFLPAGNPTRIRLTTYLVFALALEGRAKGR